MSRKFVLLGYPIGHSSSPLLHTRLFALGGHQQASYSLMELPPGSLQQPDAGARLRELDGFNVTIPYKAEVIPLLDELDPAAARFGAVNTVCNRGGKLIGYNTDVVGFVKALEKQGLTPSGRVCVVGAGGVGRMFAIESAMRGATVTIAVRASGLKKAETLAKDITALGLQAPSICLTHQLKGPFDLLINATPAGMHPNVDAMPVDAALLDNVDTVFESITNPVQTMLLREAAARGCRQVIGLEMLLWQAVAAHEIWDGAVYNPQDLAKLSDELPTLINSVVTGKENIK